VIKYEKEMNAIIEALDDSGLLSCCIIVGSWAMNFYKEIFEGFTPPIVTTDLDIFLPNAKTIKGSNIGKLLLDLDYLRDDDYVTGKTRFYSENGFEIEFLTLPNRSMSNVIKIKSINVGAEALGKLRPISWNYITVLNNGHKVNIPSPVSYCLQKLLINKDRDIAKRDKDMDAIIYIMSYIKTSPKYVDEFNQLLDKMPKKWKKDIRKTMSENDLVI